MVREIIGREETARQIRTNEQPDRLRVLSSIANETTKTNQSLLKRSFPVSTPKPVGLALPAIEIPKETLTVKAETFSGPQVVELAPGAINYDKLAESIERKKWDFDSLTFKQFRFMQAALSEIAKNTGSND